MRRTGSTSSSPRTSGRLRSIALARLLPHPANANVMDEARLAKLAENIAREENYPPLVVRPHPTEKASFQVLDGHQRLQVLERLGHERATSYLWPCDDETALRLLATLNRLEGQDDPRLRAELLRQLSELASPEELALLLPDDAASIRANLALLDANLDELLAEFGTDGAASDVRAITFAVSAEDERVIEEAVTRAAEGLDGKNRRGRALALITRSYLESAR